MARIYTIKKNLYDICRDGDRKGFPLLSRVCVPRVNSCPAVQSYWQWSMSPGRTLQLLNEHLTPDVIVIHNQDIDYKRSSI